MTPDPPYRRPSRETLAEAAAVVAAERLPLAAWDAGGDEAVPAAKWVTYLRRAGWPARTAERLCTHRHASGRVEQSWEGVVVVPATWLARMAGLIGVPWDAASRGG